MPLRFNLPELLARCAIPFVNLMSHTEKGTLVRGQKPSSISKALRFGAVLRDGPAEVFFTSERPINSVRIGCRLWTCKPQATERKVAPGEWSRFSPTLFRVPPAASPSRKGLANMAAEWTDEELAMRKRMIDHLFDGLPMLRQEAEASFVIAKEGIKAGRSQIGSSNDSMVSAKAMSQTANEPAADDATSVVATTFPIAEASEAEDVVRGWPEILTILKRPVNDGEQRAIRRLNNISNGPIITDGRPRAVKSKLFEWWNRVQTRKTEIDDANEDERERVRGAVETANVQTPFSRAGTVAHEIGGSVKKRRT